MLIKALCTGTCSLGKADVLTFCAMLRSSNAPLTIKEVDTGRDLYLTINTNLHPNKLIYYYLFYIY